MLKYAKIENENTKQVSVGLGTNVDFYKSIGMTQMEVEKAYNSKWYLMGYAPKCPEPTYAEKRQSEYPPIEEQLDMIYWDTINKTTVWQSKITEIKNKYPKI